MDVETIRNKARFGKVDVRDDEEQKVKLQESLDLLVAAGYFRARIQGLSPFDKIVGGIAWCIQSCCIDLDVDLFYHDTLTIGQKISLTERLVSVLPVLKCPFRLQPHQLQGLDAAHFLPVVQWLVKEALSMREQLSSISRAVASQHYYTFKLNLKDAKDSNIYSNVGTAMNDVRCRYRCTKNWNINSDVNATPQQRVYATLLEYTPRNLSSTENTKDLKVLKEMNATPSIATKVSSNVLLSTAAETSISTIQLQALPVEFQLDNIESEVHAVKSKLDEAITNSESLKLKYESINSLLQLERHKIKEIQHLSTDENINKITEMKCLVEDAERIKKGEQKYKEECREHVAHLNEKIKLLESKTPTIELVSPELLQKVESERLKYSRVRIKSAMTLKKLEVLKRAWDDVPGRAELAQYRHRLTELNDTVKSSERETRQFKIMYDTLCNSKMYMERHLEILNDILDKIQTPIKTSEGVVHLMAEIEQFLDSVLRNKSKVCDDRIKEEVVHAEISHHLTSLLDTYRTYTGTAHALSQQLIRNQQLLGLGT